MNKTVITNEILLNHFKTLLLSPEIDELQGGKSLLEYLAIDYFTINKRAKSTVELFEELDRMKIDYSKLLGLQRGFGNFSISSIQRVFNKAVDSIAVETQIEFYIPIDKLEWLELQVERLDRYINGKRFEFDFSDTKGDTVKRNVNIQVTGLTTPEIDLQTQLGESCIVSYYISFYINEPVASSVDYEIYFEYNNGTALVTSDMVPVSNISIASNLQPQSIPMINTNKYVGVVNLNKTIAITLTFDGFENDFIEHITLNTLAFNSDDIDNNEEMYIIIKRKNKEHKLKVAVIGHTINTVFDKTNEQHQLTLTASAHE